MPEGWFTTTHRLRFNDCDPVGHVNNAVYAVMAEAGRTDLMLAAGLQVMGGDVAMVIVRLEIDFKREMNWPGEVLIETAVSRIGGKSIHVRQIIGSNGVTAAEVVSVLVAIDAQTRKAILLDAGWHARFAPWTLPAAA